MMNYLLMPFDKNEHFWQKKIFKLIKNKIIYENYERFLDSRLENIDKISFKNLSKTLEKNIIDFY